MGSSSSKESKYQLRLPASPPSGGAGGVGAGSGSPARPHRPSGAIYPTSGPGPPPAPAPPTSPIPTSLTAKSLSHSSITGASSSKHRMSLKGGGGGPGAGVVCSARLPWLVKQARLHRPPLSSFELGRVIGRGLMGTVRLSRLPAGAAAGEEKFFAVKQVRKDYVVKHHDERHIRNEKEILQSLQSFPFAVQLLGTAQDGEHLFFLLEYLPGGDLHRLLRKKKTLSVAEAKFYFWEVFCGLEHLQRREIVFRDLKPENLLLDEDGHVKLVDFGFACHCAMPHGRMHTICGTPAYLSPEQLDSRLTHGYGPQVDWWALGVLLYEMLTGKTPFSSAGARWACVGGDCAWVLDGVAGVTGAAPGGESAYEIFLRILRQRIAFPRGFDPLARELVSGLCHPNLAKRLSGADQVKVQRFVDPSAHGLSWDDIYHRRVPPPYVPSIHGPGDCHHFPKYEDTPWVVAGGGTVAGGGGGEEEKTGSGRQQANASGGGNKKNRIFGDFSDF